MWINTELNAKIWPFFCPGNSQFVHFDWHKIPHTGVHKFTGVTVIGTDSIGHGDTVSRRTANKKLTKPYWPSQKRSPIRLIVLLEPKKWRGTTNKIFTAIRDGRVPPLSNSFLRRWLQRCNWNTSNMAAFIFADRITSLSPHVYVKCKGMFELQGTESPQTS